MHSAKSFGERLCKEIDFAMEHGSSQAKTVAEKLRKQEKINIEAARRLLDTGGN